MVEIEVCIPYRPCDHDSRSPRGAQCNVLGKHVMMNSHLNIMPLSAPPPTLSKYRLGLRKGIHHEAFIMNASRPRHCVQTARRDRLAPVRRHQLSSLKSQIKLCLRTL